MLVVKKPLALSFVPKAEAIKQRQSSCHDRPQAGRVLALLVAVVRFIVGVHHEQDRAARSYVRDLEHD